MRTTTFSSLLLIGLVSCSGNAKSLTEDGSRDLGSGDYKAALSDFEKALEKFGDDTQSTDYLRASLGRCQALAHIDPKKAAMDFIALAKSGKVRVAESDFSLIANELLRTGTTESRGQAIEVMVAANEKFPNSKTLKDVGNQIMLAAQKANDPEQVKRMSSMGYTGGGK